MKYLNKIALGLLSFTLVPAIQSFSYFSKPKSNSSYFLKAFRKKSKELKKFTEKGFWYKKRPAWYNREVDADRILESGAKATIQFYKKNKRVIGKFAIGTGLALLGAYLTKKALDMYSENKVLSAKLHESNVNARLKELEYQLKELQNQRDITALSEKQKDLYNELVKAINELKELQNNKKVNI